MKMWKWMVVVLAVLSLLAVNVGAQDFPKGQINYMNPFNPGGEVDIAARGHAALPGKKHGAPRHSVLTRGGRGSLLVEAGGCQTGRLHVGGFSIPISSCSPNS